MLHTNILHFLEYCKTANFSIRSIESLSSRLGELTDFIYLHSIPSFDSITYSHLIEFVADYHGPSVHIKKQRVWTLRQFFHFLKINKLVEKNIAQQIPYPKIGKKVPKYLTIEEFNQILELFALQADTLSGLRDLLIIMLLGFLGLRLSCILCLNIEDVDLQEGLLWIREKGSILRDLCIPQILCSLLAKYLDILNLKQGPLFLSKRKRRISERTIQHLFKKSMDKLGIDKHLHAHLFRHTAGTHLNKVAGPAITQHVLGHLSRKSTEIYIHLNPDQYAVYMRKHPYMSL